MSTARTRHATSADHSFPGKQIPSRCERMRLGQSEDECRFVRTWCRRSKASSNAQRTDEVHVRDRELATDCGKKEACQVTDRLQARSRHGTY